MGFKNQQTPLGRAILFYNRIHFSFQSWRPLFRGSKMEGFDTPPMGGFHTPSKQNKTTQNKNKNKKTQTNTNCRTLYARAIVVEPKGYGQMLVSCVELAGSTLAAWTLASLPRSLRSAWRILGRMSRVFPKRLQLQCPQTSRKDDLYLLCRFLDSA